MRRLLIIATLALPLTACGGSDADANPAADRASMHGEPIDIGLVAGYSARVVLQGLSNPTSPAVSPGGRLALCDAGHGRVLLVHDRGGASVLVSGFTVEPASAGGRFRFKHGPLSMAWLDDTRFAVTHAGLPDGAEHVLLFDRAGTAPDGVATNPIPPTTADPADQGEGGLTGLSRSRDGQWLYLVSNGSDQRTWVLRCDVAARQLSTFASADVNGVTTDAPMATLPWGDRGLLVLYAGAAGVDDSLLVEWDLGNRTPARQWRLPGITDAVATAQLPGAIDQLVIVDRPLDRADARPGKLARVTLANTDSTGSDTTARIAQVTIIAADLRGPTGCAFGHDGHLYVTQLGDAPDTDRGQLLAIDGFSPGPAPGTGTAPALIPVRPASGASAVR